jgi:2-polyprenyl-6-methoxyphenol hydroxylase-like FAD-dependent oxidoreductase
MIIFAPVKNRITIAGGGLAGLALGIGLRRRGVEVELHEALAYPRHRVCGEFISGVESSTLETLGIKNCFAEAQKLESAVWSDGFHQIGAMTVRGMGISRWRLDRELSQTFQSLGGRLHTGSRIEPREGVVWAAGRPRRESPWIGLKCHARNLPLEADLEMFSGPGGYAGLAKIEDGRVNVCGLFRKKNLRAAKGPALLLEALSGAGLESLAKRLEIAELDEKSFCGVAGFQMGRQSGPEFSIGDAASMIPPFTGNGMSMAFESAECALEPALEFSKGNLSWNESAAACEKSQRRRFRKRLAASSTLHWILTTRTGHRITSALGRRRLIPFKTLLRTLR